MVMNEIKLNLEQGKSHWYAVIEVEKLLTLYQKHCIRRQPHHLSHIIMLSGYEIQNNILEFKATADSLVLKKRKLPLVWLSSVCLHSEQLRYFKVYTSSSSRHCKNRTILNIACVILDTHLLPTAFFIDINCRK